ncbi:DUF1737 domain-containing protein [Gluconobacter albidus]|mgnify:CR=1 FL=1|uniref:DUF1737 domain-containing protein n=1 Tax=Gluconobacter albidus TaxID=318683 RepID=UPI001B8BB307|nr:DUF1737 domain-containing protein [Gluconobacter albidus]
MSSNLEKLATVRAESPDYVLLTEDSTENLSRLVTEKLSLGYRLHGSPFCSVQRTGAKVFGQALIREP